MIAFLEGFNDPRIWYELGQMLAATVALVAVGLVIVVAFKLAGRIRR